MRVADVKLSWKKSPSADITKVELVVNNGGNETRADLGPEIESYTIEVKAKTSVAFSVTVYDNEGNKATSEVYTFTLGDLELPQPASGLKHEVVGVRDVPGPDPTPTPGPGPTPTPGPGPTPTPGPRPTPASRPPRPARDEGP